MHIHIIKDHFEVRIPPKQYVLLAQFDRILKVSRSFSFTLSKNIHGSQDSWKTWNPPGIPGKPGICMKKVEKTPGI